MTRMDCTALIVKLNLRLCDYSDEYILVSGRIIITGGRSDTTAENKKTDTRKKKEYLKIVHYLLNA